MQSPTTASYSGGPGILKSKKPKMRKYRDGTRKWFLNGILHREDGPAIEDADGSRWWYLNGERHREDGPAIEWWPWTGGDVWWCRNGKLHREDGPAVEKADGTRKWFLNDKLHREDGPAIEKADGTREWYYKGMQLQVRSLKEFTVAIQLLQIQEVQES
jgi:hypothetical protein